MPIFDIPNLDDRVSLRPTRYESTDYRMFIYVKRMGVTVGDLKKAFRLKHSQCMQIWYSEEIDIVDRDVLETYNTSITKSLNQDIAALREEIDELKKGDKS